MATIQLGVINDIGIIRIAPFTAVELKCLASAVNADNSAALADAATERANAAAATALSYVGISPTGAYTNLAALQAAYQTGEDGVFVVKDTGHWYFWNGSAWEDGGEYQKDIPTTTIEELRRSDLQQMSAIKEVENTLNSININQETTNTASGYGTISLPKNAANGGMSVKLEGFTAENFLPNGDFRDGIDGWINTNFDVVQSDGVLLQKNNDQRARFRQGSVANLNATDIYYEYALIQCSVLPPAASIIFGQTNSSLVVNDFFYKYASQNTDVQRLSLKGNIDLSGNYHTLGLSVKETYQGNIKVKHMSIINLTQTFGAGNEPTVEECDTIFGEYFEGVKSFEPTGRVRSVGKNLLNVKK